MDTTQEGCPLVTVRGTIRLVVVHSLDGLGEAGGCGGELGAVGSGLGGGVLGCSSVSGGHTVRLCGDLDPT